MKHQQHARSLPPFLKNACNPVRRCAHTLSFTSPFYARIRTCNQEYECQGARKAHKEVLTCPDCQTVMFQAGRSVRDLFEDLRDGHNLLSLLEVLSGEILVRVICVVFSAGER